MVLPARQLLRRRFLDRRHPRLRQGVPGVSLPVRPGRRNQPRLCLSAEAGRPASRPTGGISRFGGLRRAADAAWLARAAFSMGIAALNPSYANPPYEKAKARALVGRVGPPRCNPRLLRDSCTTRRCVRNAVLPNPSLKRSVLQRFELGIAEHQPLDAF